MANPLRSGLFSFCLCATACAGPPQVGSDAGDAVTPTDSATANQVLDHFSFGVYATCANNTPVSACQTNVQVVVFDARIQQIPDAVVTVNDQPVPHVGNLGQYIAIQPGFAPSYHLVVTRGTDRLSAMLTSPSDFTFTVSPDPPVANMPVTLSWNPAQEGAIAEVHVGSFSMQGDDSGQLTIAASVFPAAGSYTINFSRNVAAADSTILLGRSRMVTVQ